MIWREAWSSLWGSSSSEHHELHKHTIKYTTYTIKGQGFSFLGLPMFWMRVMLMTVSKSKFRNQFDNDSLWKYFKTWHFYSSVSFSQRFFRQFQVLNHITEVKTVMLLSSKTTSDWFQRSYRHHKAIHNIWKTHWPAMGLENKPRACVSSIHLMSNPFCLKTHIWSVTTAVSIDKVCKSLVCQTP